MSDDYKLFPKGRLAMGGGDLQDITEIQQKESNGAKNIGTMRNPTAGAAEGEHTNEMTWKGVVSQDGFERDFRAAKRKMKVVQMRFKLPGETITQTGVITSLEVTSNKDGAIEYSCTHIGTLS